MFITSDAAPDIIDNLRNAAIAEGRMAAAMDNASTLGLRNPLGTRVFTDVLVGIQDRVLLGENGTLSGAVLSGSVVTSLSGLFERAYIAYAADPFGPEV